MGSALPVLLPEEGPKGDVYSLNLQHFWVSVFITNWQVFFCLSVPILEH